MASIDKTYTNSYNEYKEFKDWAEDKKVKFFDGSIEFIKDYIFYYEESDFIGKDIPIMNSQTWMDCYLIQNCKIKFILDRMKYVYSKRYYNELMFKKFIEIPSEFKKNRKVTIKRTNKTLFPIHNKPYGYNNRKNWWLQCEVGFYYNSQTKVWANHEQLYPTDTNTAHIGSLKAIIRHLRKQYLPSGIKFYMIGSYVGEQYELIIK